MLKQFIRDVMLKYNNGQCVPLKTILSHAVSGGIYTDNNVFDALKDMERNGELTMDADRGCASLK